MDFMGVNVGLRGESCMCEYGAVRDYVLIKIWVWIQHSSLTR